MQLFSIQCQCVSFSHPHVLYAHTAACSGSKQSICTRSWMGGNKHHYQKAPLKNTHTHVHSNLIQWRGDGRVMPTSNTANNHSGELQAKAHTAQNNTHCSGTNTPGDHSGRQQATLRPGQALFPLANMWYMHKHAPCMLVCPELWRHGET